MERHLNNNQKDETKDQDKKDIWFKDIMIALFAVGATVSVCVYLFAINHTDRARKLGEVGDFLGGTLNPILTFLSFVGILFTIYLQRLELVQSRRELERSADALEEQISSIEKQNFEAAFFQMLSSFNGVVASIDLTNSKTATVTSGRDCFSVFYTRLTKIFRETQKKAKPHHSPDGSLRLSYHIFWKEHQKELGHYFRILFNIFRFLDQSSASEDYHAKILRAQLSDQELLLLFYNCNSTGGKNFKEYAIKYKLFDNLPTILLLEDSHVDLIDRAAFGANPMYNSKNIRDSVPT